MHARNNPYPAQSVPPRLAAHPYFAHDGTGMGCTERGSSRRHRASNTPLEGKVTGSTRRAPANPVRSPGEKANPRTPQVRGRGLLRDRAGSVASRPDALLPGGSRRPRRRCGIRYAIRLLLSAAKRACEEAGPALALQAISESLGGRSVGAPFYAERTLAPAPENGVGLGPSAWSIEGGP